MRIAFYAPLKSPSHAKPSGDREIGRLLLKALNALDHEVNVVSDLRSWEAHGCQQRQKDIRRAAMKEVRRIAGEYACSTPPDIVLTYHVYHKAPDWIGIELADIFKIPYVVAEASYAPKRINGPWHHGHMQTIRCIQRADRIITLNPADVGCLKFLVKDSDKIALIKPFLGEIPVPPHGIADAGEHRSASASKMPGRKTVILITVAMMREGDKKASYWLLSQALRSLDTTNWKLIIIGGGNAATEIRQFFNNLSGKCIFTGEIDNREIFNYLAKADIFVWPAVNEALGLAILEAQAYGLPAVAQNYGGVSTIIEHQVTGYVTDPDDFGAFVSALKMLMHDGHKRHCMSRAAKCKFESEHSFRSALSRLKAILDKLEYR